MIEVSRRGRDARPPARARAEKVRKKERAIGGSSRPHRSFVTRAAVATVAVSSVRPLSSLSLGLRPPRAEQGGSAARDYMQKNAAAAAIYALALNCDSFFFPVTDGRRKRTVGPALMTAGRGSVRRRSMPNCSMPNSFI